MQEPLSTPPKLTNPPQRSGADSRDCRSPPACFRRNGQFGARHCSVLQSTHLVIVVQIGVSVRPAIARSQRAGSVTCLEVQVHTVRRCQSNSAVR